MTVATTGAANILMVSDGKIAHTASSGPGDWPLFLFNDTLAGVTIIDHSGATLRIGDIDVVAPTSAQPTVWLVTRSTAVDPTNPGTPYTLQFDVRRGSGESFIDIQKLAPGFLFLVGHLNNPVGWTHILHAAGDILSISSGRVTANVVHLEAPVGDIGTVVDRIGTELVQKPGCRRPAGHLRRSGPDDPAVGDGRRPDRATA